MSYFSLTVVIISMQLPQQPPSIAISTINSTMYEYNDCVAAGEKWKADMAATRLATFYSCMPVKGAK